ncbi:MAG: hypothetical protein QE271_03575 [Bacteriovoracaceae bacterium]|nr:hypothetical protein [Bacteriovoracaceae bacterium]
MIINQLGLTLSPVSFQQLTLLAKCLSDVYTHHEGTFVKVFEGDQKINPKVLSAWRQKGIYQFFVAKDDQKKIYEMAYKNFQEVTRQLSIGQPLEKGTIFLTQLGDLLNMLYDDYQNEELLRLIFHTSQSFYYYLEQNSNLIRLHYGTVARLPISFYFKQPILSSLFMIGFLLEYQIAGSRENVDLFSVSLLKDVGMSLVPRDSWNKKVLDQTDRLCLDKHSNHSVMLLREHLPLNKSQLHIIEHHHFQNELVRKIINDDKSINSSQDVIQGFETMIVAISDLVAAMTSERPYRPKYPSEVVQNVIKSLTQINYPTETKMLINFFRNFYME